MFRYGLFAACCVCATISATQAGNQTEPFRATQQTALDSVDAHRDSILDVNQTIWRYAEVGLQEHKSAKILTDRLQQSGFKVETGIAGIPTAFVASYGSGKPVIGILAEYDALPGISQKLSPLREPLEEGGNGHGCGL